MHGERSRRHQHVVTGSRGQELIVSFYEVRHERVGAAPTLAVEYYDSDRGVTSAWLMVEEAKAQRDALTEFIDAWSPLDA
jgi:hypothetical protein